MCREISAQMSSQHTHLDVRVSTVDRASNKEEQKEGKVIMCVDPGSLR